MGEKQKATRCLGKNVKKKSQACGNFRYNDYRTHHVNQAPEGHPQYVPCQKVAVKIEPEGTQDPEGVIKIPKEGLDVAAIASLSGIQLADPVETPLSKSGFDPQDILAENVGSLPWCVEIEYPLEILRILDSVVNTKYPEENVYIAKAELGSGNTMVKVGKSGKLKKRAASHFNCGLHLCWSVEVANSSWVEEHVFKIINAMFAMRDGESAWGQQILVREPVCVCGTKHSEMFLVKGHNLEWIEQAILDITERDNGKYGQCTFEVKQIHEPSI